MTCVLMLIVVLFEYCFFFFNDTATTEIYTLSLHDALPISARSTTAAGATEQSGERTQAAGGGPAQKGEPAEIDRKSTRLNSSHSQISYAVFCLKKKKQTASNRGDCSAADLNSCDDRPTNSH